MSKTAVIATLTFILGVGAGGVAGIMLTKKRFEEKANAEVEEALSYYEEKFGPADPTTSTNQTTEDIALQPEVSSIEFSKEEHDSYAKEIVKYHSAAVDGEVEESYPEPYTITQHQYATDKSYKKMLLTYFEVDNKFVTVDDEELEDGVEWVGKDNLDQFDDDNDIIYVRNEGMSTDFSITREHMRMEDFYED